MASLNCEGIDNLMLSLKDISEIPSGVKEDILNAQSDIIVKAQKEKGITYGVHKTGLTITSIKKGGPKTKNGIMSIYVTPTGKNKDGNRNAEVAFVNNYGRRNQKARPFITDANEQSTEATTKAALSVYDKWLKSKDL